MWSHPCSEGKHDLGRFFVLWQHALDNRGLIYEREIPRLWRYAQSLRREPDHAEDPVQECLLRAIEKIHTWQPGTNLRAWLFVILRNCHLNEIRRERRIVSNDDDSPSSGPTLTVPGNQEICVALAEVRNAYLSLSEEHREVLLLVAIEGLQYKEASAILECPSGRCNRACLGAASIASGSRCRPGRGRPRRIHRRLPPSRSGYRPRAAARDSGGGVEQALGLVKAPGPVTLLALASHDIFQPRQRRKFSWAGSAAAQSSTPGGAWDFDSIFDKFCAKLTVLSSCIIAYHRLHSGVLRSPRYLNWCGRQDGWPHSFPDGRSRFSWHAHWMSSSALINSGSGHIPNDSTAADGLIRASLRFATATAVCRWSSRSAILGAVMSFISQRSFMACCQKTRNRPGSCLRSQRDVPSRSLSFPK
jgi:RNA polymerase sigma-70 factor (ECF subfamily)